MYTLFLTGSIPATRIFSYNEFKKHQSGKIKQYVLELLESYPNGLTCRQISEISGIEVQSLTHPLKTLQDKGSIKVIKIDKNHVTNRLVQVYSLEKTEL